MAVAVGTAPVVVSAPALDPLAPVVELGAVVAPEVDPEFEENCPLRSVGGAAGPVVFVPPASELFAGALLRVQPACATIALAINRVFIWFVSFMRGASFVFK